MPAVPALLRLLSNPVLTGAEARAARSLAETTTDGWPALADAARRSGTGGLVYRNLERAELLEALPPLHRQALRAAYAATLADNLRRLQAADLVHGALTEAGIIPLLLKGAALVETHYRDPGQRPMRDLDLLVRPTDLDRAESVLEQLGFRRRRTPGRERSEDAYYQRSYVRGPERVELHMALCDESRYPVDVAALWSRARSVSWRGTTALTLDEADHLAYVALHAALHGYILPLTCLVDQSVLLRRSQAPATLAARAVEVARAWRAGTAVYLAFRLAQRLVGAPFEDSLLASLRPDPVRGLYLRACFHEDRMPAFRYGTDLRRAQALSLFPLMDGGRASYLTHYARLRIADWFR